MLLIFNILVRWLSSFCILWNMTRWSKSRKEANPRAGTGVSVRGPGGLDDGGGTMVELGA